MSENQRSVEMVTIPRSEWEQTKRKLESWDAEMGQWYRLGQCGMVMLVSRLRGLYAQRESTKVESGDSGP